MFGQAAHDQLKQHVRGVWLGSQRAFAHAVGEIIKRVVADDLVVESRIGGVAVGQPSEGFIPGKVRRTVVVAVHLVVCAASGHRGQPGYRQKANDL